MNMLLHVLASRTIMYSICSIIPGDALKTRRIGVVTERLHSFATTASRDFESSRPLSFVCFFLTPQSSFVSCVLAYKPCAFNLSTICSTVSSDNIYVASTPPASFFMYSDGLCPTVHRTRTFSYSPRSMTSFKNALIDGSAFNFHPGHDSNSAFVIVAPLTDVHAFVSALMTTSAIVTFFIVRPPFPRRSRARRGWDGMSFHALVVAMSRVTSSVVSRLVVSRLSSLVSRLSSLVSSCVRSSVVPSSVVTVVRR